jgi:O-antigen/teichoic acid export membrane protein
MIDVQCPTDLICHFIFYEYCDGQRRYRLVLRTRHIVRNVIFNWLGNITAIAVGFFLAPFILHRLGDLAYGVWILAVQVIAYTGLLDLGMQSAVLRFVSKGHAQKDHKGASEAVSAALWVRLQISSLIVLLSGGLAFVFPFIFKIPSALAHSASVSIFLIGIKMAVIMSVGVVAGVFSALNRYDLQNYLNFAQTAVRVVGVVVVLHMGHGIVAIAVCELIAALIYGVLLIVAAHRLYPELKIEFKKPSKQTLKQVWVYSSYAFLTTIAVQLVYQTDLIVVGAFVSAAAVTYYAIANSLCSYLSQGVNSISATLVPAASAYEAVGNSANLLRLYKKGTQAILTISLPVVITLLFRGSSFIGLWMGQKYAHRSGIVLSILLTALLFSFANRAASAISFGIEKHKVSAMWAICEGVSNLSLSIILARRYGIYGVALGTMIPSLIIHIFLWPSYVKHLVGLSYTEVVWKTWSPILLASIPFTIATYAINRYCPAHSLIIFALQIIAVLPIYAIVIGLIFREFVSTWIFPRMRSIVGRYNV